ncbi:MAG: DUF5320 domain-containing protein [Chloroflexota bacterium]|nr:DUF5320 domain-containing protein [Chloroflexota bacterium]
MPGRSGRGRGFGFRGSSPPWPYVGRGRGGLPRCAYPGAYEAVPRSFDWMPHPYYGGGWGGGHYGGAAAYGAYPHTSEMSREEELNVLKEEADAVKAQLDEIESRIRSLEGL